MLAPLAVDRIEITTLVDNVTDSLSREITSATDSVRIYVTGDGTVTSADGSPLPVATDTAGAYTPVALERGVRHLGFRAGSTPGRTFKSMRMAGRMGNERVTVQGLQVVKVDPERNLLLLRGAVPGAKNGLLFIRQARKTRLLKRARK